MRILAIETSCDETAISIIEADEFKPDLPRHSNGRGEEVRVLSNVVLSQVKKHAEYGGVFPSLAVREHSKNLVPVLEKALAEASLLQPKSQNTNPNYSLIRTNKRIVGVLEREPELQKQFLDFIPTIEKPDTRPVRDSESSQRENSNGIDAIAVTFGPGLEPTLWVGINFAKALAVAWDLPLIPINHMEGHIFSALLKKCGENGEGRSFSSQTKRTVLYNVMPIEFPALALLISGGHTELVLMRDWFKYEIVGQTKDDAVGEAFDKVARMLGLGYPGGPEIARHAAMASGTDAEQKRGTDAEKIKLPRPMLESGDFNFSFSGLKTAVLYKVKSLELSYEKTLEISYEFQEAVTEVLVSKTLAAAEHYGAKTILVGGGVSANQRIRDVLAEETRYKRQDTRDKIQDTRDKIQDTNLLFAPMELTGDNALMIAVAAWARQSLRPQKYSLNEIHAAGNVRLG